MSEPLIGHDGAGLNSDRLRARRARIMAAATNGAGPVAADQPPPPPSPGPPPVQQGIPPELAPAMAPGRRCQAHLDRPAHGMYPHRGRDQSGYDYWCEECAVARGYADTDAVQLARAPEPPRGGLPSNEQVRGAAHLGVRGDE